MLSAVLRRIGKLTGGARPHAAPAGLGCEQVGFSLSTEAG